MLPNQSFASTTSLASAPTAIIAPLKLINDQVGAAADAYAMDIDSLPLEQLLQSEWFHQNISQMLNISVDNLTSLLINAQHQQSTNSSSIERDPLWLLVTLSTFYGLIFLAGILGNLITCIVISRNKFMHTATNFYLFNLAVSDLILLLSGMPQELYNTWYPEEYPFDNILCKMEGIFSETAANATVLTITAFTVERYIAICHPFRQHTMSKLSRAIKFILAIWVTAFLLALPQAMQFSVVPQNNGLACTMKNDFFAHVFAVSGFIFFGGPMTAICVLYVLIGVKLKRSRLLQAVPRRCYDVNRGISAQSRVIRMLVAVAVAFFLCWAPFHAQRLMAAYGSTATFTSELFNDIYHILNYISGVLYFLSTCINPLLYNIMSHKFREAFKVTLARQFGLSGNYQMQNHNYSALMRQNGSMRLHTTVNNNAFEHFNSYRVVQLQCRDPTHHLSLQDSIRTTTTTTTINSAGGYNGIGGGGGTGGGGGGGVGGGSNSCRSSNRNRCISIGSQSTLLHQLSKPDVFSTGSMQVPNRANGEHRMLQSQISQLSSVGDANSLLEADISTSYHTHTHSHQHAHQHPTSYRLKELQRSMTTSNNGKVSGAIKSTNSAPLPDAECFSLDSQDWQTQDNINDETDAITKPVAPQIMAATLVATQPVQPMNSIAELTMCQPSRSRLKLSRIITRRDRDILITQTSPRVELMRKHLPGMGHQHMQHIPLGHLRRNSQESELFGSFKRSRVQTTQPRATTKALDSLADRFRWRTKRATKVARAGMGSGATGSQRLKESSLETASTSTPALMRIVYPATTISTAAIMEGDLERSSSSQAL